MTLARRASVPEQILRLGPEIRVFLCACAFVLPLKAVFES